MDPEYTILIDKREKRPFSFPSNLVLTYPSPSGRGRIFTVALKTRRTTLETGDYALLNYESRCLVERKANIDEVLANTRSSDRSRFTRCLDRLSSACGLPVLLLERPYDFQLKMRGEGLRSPEEAARSDLIWMCISRGITLSCLPAATPKQKKKAAEWVATTLVLATQLEQ